MGAGASLLQDELTRDEAKALVPESKWDDGWDANFAEGKRVARELAERVWNGKYPQLRGGVDALDFWAIVNEKRGQYLPGTRECVFEAVMRWRTDPEATKLFWLVGRRRTGKTVAAAELLMRLLDKENAAAWHFCKYTEPGRSAPAVLLRSLAGMLCASVEGFEDALKGSAGVETDKVDELFEALVAKPLRSVEAPRGADDALILIIDALDELPRDALRPVLSLLATELKTLPPWIKIVATSRDEAQIKAALSGYTPSELRFDGARSRQDARAYLTVLAKEHVEPGVTTDSMRHEEEVKERGVRLGHELEQGKVRAAELTSAFFEALDARSNKEEQDGIQLLMARRRMEERRWATKADPNSLAFPVLKPGFDPMQPPLRLWRLCLWFCRVSAEALAAGTWWKDSSSIQAYDANAETFSSLRTFKVVGEGEAATAEEVSVDPRDLRREMVEDTSGAYDPTVPAEGAWVGRPAPEAMSDEEKSYFANFPDLLCKEKSLLPGLVHDVGEGRLAAWESVSSDKLFAEDVVTVDEIYAENFRRVFVDDGTWADALPLVELICAAAEPLTIDAASGALGWDRAQCKKVCDSVSLLFPLREEDVVGVLHKTVTDWLAGEAPFDKRSSEDAFFVARDAPHRRLARACARAIRAGVLDTESFSSDAAADEVLASFVEGEGVASDAYALRWCLFHMKRSRSEGEAIAVACALSYVQKRVEFGDIGAFAGDLDVLKGRDALLLSWLPGSGGGSCELEAPAPKVLCYVSSNPT
jgi:hypothetical protein